MISQLIIVALLASTAVAGLLPAATPLFAPTPLAFSAPLLAAAPVAYTRAIPQNVPPFASSVNIVNRGVSLPYAYAPGLSPYVETIAPLQRYSYALPAPFTTVV